MSTQYAVIYLGNGVSAKIEITTEPKHYTESERDEALDKLAKALGGDFFYVEKEPE